MIRLSRKEIVNKIVRLANLPPGKGTSGYFTRKQLVELSLYIEGMKELGRHLKTEGIDDASSRS